MLKQWVVGRRQRILAISGGLRSASLNTTRYNCTVRYDWLNTHLFTRISEVQDFATRWLWTYHHERPNRGLGGITPMQKLALMA